MGFQVLYLIFGEGIAFPGKAAQSTDFLGSNDIILLHETVPFRKNGKDITIELYAQQYNHHAEEIGEEKACQLSDTDVLAEIFATGKYAVFTKGRYEHSPQNPIAGVGNFVLDLINGEGRVLLPLIHLDSNVYGDGWFFSGFDCIHEDQTDWCMEKLNERKVPAMAFFHMPPAEFKEAYEKMKLGNHTVIYEHGSIGEKDEYFGISNRPPHFFEKAVDNGWLKWIFCGHDHLNTLSLTYKGIRMTYGMSIDYLGYSGIAKQYIQRGATLITRKTDGNIDITMVPLTTVVSTRVRGA